MQVGDAGAIGILDSPTDHLAVFMRATVRVVKRRRGERWRRRRRAEDYSEEELRRAVEKMDEKMQPAGMEMQPDEMDYVKMVAHAREVMDKLDREKGREPGGVDLMDDKIRELLQQRRTAGMAMRAHWTRQLWCHLRRERRRREALRAADLIRRSKVGGVLKRLPLEMWHTLLQ